MVMLALIVTLLAIGSSVIVGVAGHLIDKNADPAEDEAGGMESKR